MKLDLRRDFDEICAYLVDRVQNFDPASHEGPGEPGPVKMIEVAFNFGQHAWVAVVFDTRPDAEPDGEYSSYMEGVLLERPHWLWEEADYATPNASITVVLADGVEQKCQSELPDLLGDLIKTVLLKARADGVFADLPKAPGCELGIEHLEGHYGWPEYEKRGEENLV